MRKRVFFSLLPAIFLLLMALPAASAETAVCTQHVRTTQVRQEATCTEYGYYIGVCAICGTPLDNGDAIPPLGHDFQVTVFRQPTCTEEGWAADICSRCGAENGDSYAIPALAHNYQETVSRQPTCTEEGWAAEICTNCGAGKDNGHSIAALGHAWDNGVVTSQATCTAAGAITYTCSRCGGTYTETIPAAAHSPTLIPAVAATCTDGGKTEGSQCSVCGTILAAPQDTAPLGHAMDNGIITTQATCTTAGVKTYTCTRCGGTFTEAIPAGAHSPAAIPAVPATCTAGGKTEGSQCSVCGTILIAPQDTAALGHAWDNGIVTTQATCIAAGVKTYTCSRCGLRNEEVLPMANHIPFTLPGTPATCMAGGKTDGSQCSACGRILIPQTDIPALDHDWDEGTVTREAGLMQDGETSYTCVRCGETKTETVPAMFGNKSSGSDAGSLFMMLHSLSPDDGSGESGGPLTIVTQPQPGKVSRDGTFRHTMTVEVTGGVPPYSYQWRYHNSKSAAEYREGLKSNMSSGKAEEAIKKLSGSQTWASAFSVTHLWDAGDMAKAGSAAGAGTGSSKAAAYAAASAVYDMGAMADALSSLLDAAAGAAAQAGTGGASASLPSAFDLLSSPGFDLSSFSPVDGEKAEEIAQQAMENMSNNHILQDGTENSYTAYCGNRLYDCVITDAAGSTVTTESVTVGYLPRFIRQPQDINSYYNVERVFTTEVADGMPPYSYQWYQIDSDGRTIIITDAVDSAYQVPKGQTGKFFCEVTDAEGYSARSATARHYNAAPLMVIGPFDVEWEGRPVMLSATIIQGLPPYEVKWYDYRGDLVLSEVTDENVPTQIEAEYSGDYMLVVRDDAGTTQNHSCKVEKKPLTIVKQPEFGKAVYGKPHTLSIIISDGRAPFLYALEKDGEIVETAASDQRYYDFSVTEGGRYRIHVYDEDDREGVSNEAGVTDDAFSIFHRTEEARITDPNGSASLRVMIVGGTPPYTYLWEKYNPSTKGYDHLRTDQKTNAEQSSLETKETGNYRCTITDSVGRSLVSANMMVKYTGEKPWIIQQPQEVIYSYYDSGMPYAKLSCNAVSGSGNAGNLQYTWSKYTNWLKLVDGNIGTGRTLTLQESYGNPIDGYYACKVTDLSTGEYSWTKTVKVAMKLEPLSGAEIGSGKAYNHILQVEFVGGLAPYRIITVRFDRVMYVRGAGGYIPMDEGRQIHEYDEHPFFTDLSTEHHAKFIIQTHWGVEYGQNTYEVKSGTYYITVQDALGQYSECVFSVSAPTDLKRVW